jgi:DUF3108-like
MNRTHLPNLIALLALSVVLGVGSAAPRSKDPLKAPVYLATRVGDTWVYKAADRDETRVVTAVEEKDGVKVVSVGRVGQDEKVTLTETIGVSANGLAWLAIEGVTLETPGTYLKLPLTAGATWEVHTKGSAPTVELKGKMTVAGWEEVTVPAGKYKAVRINWDCQANGQPYPAALWYAEGIGVVKMTLDDAEVLVLKSFTPGK